MRRKLSLCGKILILYYVVIGIVAYFLKKWDFIGWYSGIFGG